AHESSSKRGKGVGDGCDAILGGDTSRVAWVRIVGDLTVSAWWDLYQLARNENKASGRSKLTREPKQINAQLGKQTGAELSALFARRCLVPPSGLCRPVWISRLMKPAEDRVAGEFNPAGRLTGPCDNFFNVKLRRSRPYRSVCSG